MAIYRGAGGAGDATNDATSQSILAAQSAQEAAASEAAAASSASSAATSASNAASSATSAASSATSASNSASSAATQAANAASSATTATTKASEAADSATAAASSATAAATSATNASNSATAAANSATSASNSASAASTSATNAATYAFNAATSATNAAASETNAAASANSASNSATSAAASATSAGNSASSATTSATNAASSASAAATSASNAATSATNASNSATSASTSATNAANSATSASTSATNAASSATAAAASYDSFDDRYLGSKTSNPTLDNDGNALLTGALYWNSTVGEMRVYTGSSWTAAYVPAATYVAKAGDVMTGSLEVPTQASLKATALTRASIRPNLLLDFANTKQLDPRITFSRPTTATYYDGKTAVKAEENLLLRSAEFDNASWGKSNATVTANATTAPDGTTTAESMVGDGTSNFHLINQSISTLVSANSYVFSVYAKANGLNFVQLHTNSSGDGRANFNITAGAGALGTVSGNFSGAVITDVGNGWYRCSAVITGSTAIFVQIALISSSTSARAEVFTTSSGVFLWGAQLEQRSTVTDYTPTTTAPITNYIPALQTAVSNDARFDHDPVTGESKGLLIEEQRTNLLTYSADFSNAAWIKTNMTVTADSAVAPDGTLTASKIIPSTVSNYHYINRNSNYGVTLGTTYTRSVFIKKAGYNFVLLNSEAINNSGPIVDLTLGQVVASFGSGSYTTNIVSVGNGWWKVSITFTATSTFPSSFDVNVLPTSTVSPYTGDGFSGIYIWGAQLEAGSFPTSYIPTVASQVTRSADSASMTGSNFSSWYRADEGTVYADFLCNSSASDRALTFRDSTNNGRVWLSSGDGAIYLNSTFQAQFLSAAGTNPAKRAITFSFNNAAGVLNGGSVGTDTSVLIPTAINQAGIGNNATGGAYLNGTIKRIAFWPKRLSNSELQGLTS